MATIAIIALMMAILFIPVIVAEKTEILVLGLKRSNPRLLDSPIK